MLLCVLIHVDDYGSYAVVAGSNVRAEIIAMCVVLECCTACSNNCLYYQLHVYSMVLCN